MNHSELQTLIEKTFRELTSNSTHLPKEDVDLPILDMPLVGIADANDALFDTYKQPDVIGSNYRKPTEWLPNAKAVLCFFFPFTKEIRDRHRASKELTDEAWMNGYPQANANVVAEFADLLSAKLEKLGITSVFPNRDRAYPNTPELVMNGDVEAYHYNVAWSTRHACFAAGLGTFGVHRHLITENGSCGTLLTLVVDAPFEATPRTYTDIYEHCTRCGACTKRCPANGITLEYLRNTKLCGEHGAYLRNNGYGGPCGKCLVGTPCEARNPTK